MGLDCMAEHGGVLMDHYHLHYAIEGAVRCKFIRRENKVHVFQDGPQKQTNAKCRVFNITRRVHF